MKEWPISGAIQWVKVAEGKFYAIVLPSPDAYRHGYFSVPLMGVGRGMGSQLFKLLPIPIYRNGNITAYCWARMVTLWP